VDTQLINVPADQQDTVEASARIGIGAALRTDHAEAVRELQQIAAEASSPPMFLTIGGWPALQHRHLEQRPQPGQSSQSADEGEEFRFDDEMVLRITTAVAAGDLLVRLEAELPSDADENLIDQVEAIGRSLVFTTPGDPGQVQQDLEQLRRSQGQRGSLVPPLPPDDTSTGLPPLLEVRIPPQSLGPSRRVLVGGNGELEIAVSTDGQNIVIGRQSAFVTSNDGGLTFRPPGSIPFGNSDPSLAFGQSGNFYYAGIDSGGRNLCPVGSTCTAMARSIDNGQTFRIIANAFVCPNAGPNRCFPDQEHIAADRVNAGLGGDQVYAVWRNLNSTGVVSSLICSQDSGATWTAPLSIEVGGDFPRIAVGQDGFVYVIYILFPRTNVYTVRLHKYSSCSSSAGFTPQMGFPQTIASINNVACPALPGLDRCNDGNVLSSPMVAVDDTNPNHIYVAYAHRTVVGVTVEPVDDASTVTQTENILVRDSLDGGRTWLAERIVRVNDGGTGRRFMPWICATGGTAFVTWYDRRAAGQPLSNDLTNYFGGSAFVGSTGDLTSGGEFQITRAADPQCASGWPCGTRNMANSESCSVQPQLAGLCLNPMPGTTSSNNPCDFSNTPGIGTSPCLAGEVCSTGGGCPKYGDYNGNACAAGRFFTAWASATPPPGITPSGRIDIFYAASALPPSPSPPCGAALCGPDELCCNQILGPCVTSLAFCPEVPRPGQLCGAALCGPDELCCNELTSQCVPSGEDPSRPLEVCGF
jgi:hypothetical protein